MNEELAQFQQWLRLRERSENTVESYTQLLSKYYELGEDSMAYLARTVPLSTSTRNSYKIALKALFKFRGEQPDIDAEFLEPKKPTNQHYVLIPREQMNDIIASTRPHWKTKDFPAWRLHVMVELLAYCGIRPAELIGIRIDHVGDDKIWINGIKREDGGHIYPPAIVFKDIRRLLELGEYPDSKGKLFNISTARVWELVKDATGYRPKDFRTTFGTEVARQTKDPYMVQILMRHRNMASSMPYVHLGAEYGRKVQEVKLYG